ncbi:chromosome maintenance protein [Theileria orientalis strain Shintoku]|uniref:Structural maintenance of chromosomes protein 5 n=1 Tax=Theileria orientalis strain Shintoku TaxID=869250 RepID=J4C4E4_THEOR|nr:chromosome maintenance protein [Theileria orientalis strain Shintoku]BAM42041.1 chromosome maintenance protein [Theileria orientalis strain Shintoku]|eukprot:XP_009692342.1 chromosome maintenance protein [Theileria orientalis strain Shintoku]
MNYMRNGSIRYISMENWMAYTGPVVLVAKPGVNIIAASNGSGKSAIVCAIALSLGFDVNIVSRGDNIRSFVKRGCSTSVLKVGLVDDQTVDSTLHIERRITLIENASKEDSEQLLKAGQPLSKNTVSVKNEWLLNGKHTCLDSIKASYRKLNIQLENLLTFLAQANVGKFAAMTPQELFRSTLNAINLKYMEEFDNLVELSQNLKSKVSESKLIEEQLQSCENKLSELKIMNDSMTKLKDATLYRNIIKLKLYQVQKKIKLSNITKGYEVTRKRIGDTNNEIYTSETRYNRQKEKYRKMESAARGLYEDSKSKIDQANRIMGVDGPEHKANSITESSNNEPVEQAFYDTISLLTSLASDIKRARSREKISGDADSIKEKMEQITDEIKNLKSQLVSNDEIVNQIAKEKVNEENLRYKLRKYANLSTLKFEQLQFESLMNHLPYMKRDLISRYVNHYKNKPSEIHPIVINDVRVKGKLNRAIVEDTIGNYLDCILLKNSEYESNLSILKNFRLPIVTVPAEPNVLCKVSKKMKLFGVKEFVHELIEASEDTIQCLASLCQINETFIIDEGFYREYFLKNKNPEQLFNNFYATMLDEISSQTGKRVNSFKYFVGRKKHLYKHFAESNYFLDSESVINDNPKVLMEYASYGVKSENRDVSTLEMELDKSIKQLYELNNKLSENNGLNKHLNKKIYELGKQQISLEKSLKTLSTTDHQSKFEKNWTEELEKLTDQRSKILNTSIMESSKNLLLRLQKSAHAKNMLLEASETYNGYCDQMNEIKERGEALKESQTQIETLKSNLSLLKNTHEEQKIRMDNYKSIIAQTKRDIKTSEEMYETSYLNEEQTRTFGEIKKDFENRLINLTEIDLEKELIKADEQLSNLENDDIEEIKLIKMIQEERMNKKKHNDDLGKIRDEIRSLTDRRNREYEEWKQRVKQLVKEIDENFGRYMKYIGDGSDGQVRLELNVEDIKETRLRILVKFDCEKDLLPLLTSYQSGGERGVTTMVYIISVQNLTKNPFFVIDEINQGLDSHYERKLMKLLLRSPNESPSDSQDSANVEFRGEGTMPQYFILTPQLISGYDLSNATLHFPLNGPGIERSLEF